MNKNKNVLAFLLIVTAMLAAACQPAPQADNAQIAVIVSLTQTAAALANPPAATIAAATETVQAPSATSTPVASQASGDYQPLSADQCSGLKDALSQTISLSGQITSSVDFQDFVNKKAGSGCQIAFSMTGEDMSNSVTTAMTSLGWQENIAYGAGGPGALLSAYQKEGVLCLYSFKVQPADPNACPAGDGYFTCMGNLPKEQLLFSVTLNCARPNP